MPVNRTYRFHEVFEEEVQAINQRRRRFGRAEVELELEARAVSNGNSEHHSGAGSPGPLSTAQGQSASRNDAEPITRPTAIVRSRWTCVVRWWHSLGIFLPGRVASARQDGCSEEYRLPFHGVGRGLHRYLFIGCHDPFEG